MTAGTVFPRATLDRDTMPWDGRLADLTPVQAGPSGQFYKREDWFAPLGYGGPNGSKLRQLIRLVGGYHAAGGRAGVLTGASVLSPQNSMAALVAAHYGLPVHIVLGATRPETAVKHDNIAIADAVGATFTYLPVGFNPALQREVARQADAERAGWYRLHYGISTAAGCAPEDVEAFHAVGAAQVANIPPTVKTLVMTLGSGNSAASVLYGVALHRPAGLERIVLLGIGPNRLAWMWERLRLIEAATGRKIRREFWHNYHHHPGLADAHMADASPTAPIEIEHWDLHTTRFATYQDRMPFRYDGIDFHPTYEGKALTYMAARDAAERERADGGPFGWWWRGEPGTACFWIVGSRPDPKVLAGLVG